MKNLNLVFAFCALHSFLLAQSPGFEQILYTNACGDYSMPNSAMGYTSDGGYLIAAGLPYSGLDETFDAAVFRLSAQGDTIWTRTYGSPVYPEVIRHILPLSDGNYLLSGSKIDSTGTMFIWLLKINPLGDVVWEKEVDPGWIYGWPTAVFELGNGALVFAGNSVDQTFYQSAFLLQLSADADFIFIKYYDNFSDYYDVSVLRNDAGDFFYAGIKSDASFNDRFSLTKIDSHGNPLWSKTYYTFPDLAFGSNPKLSFAPNGGFYLTGTDLDFDQIASVGVVFRLQANGSQVWKKYFYGAINTDIVFYNSLATDDGGVLVLNETQQLVKYLPNGDTSYTFDLHPYLADSAFVYNMFRAHDGSPLLVGNVYPRRVYIRKLPEPLFTPTLEPQLEIGALEVFPNPCTDRFYLKLEDPELPADLPVQLLDASGKLLREYTLSKGATVQGFELKNYPPGQYQVRVQTGRKIWLAQVLKM